MIKKNQKPKHTTWISKKTPKSKTTQQTKEKRVVVDH